MNNPMTGTMALEVLTLVGEGMAQILFSCVGATDPAHIDDGVADRVRLLALVNAATHTVMVDNEEYNLLAFPDGSFLAFDWEDMSQSGGNIEIGLDRDQVLEAIGYGDDE